MTSNLSSQPTRQPAGVPIGGQFAPESRAHADVALDSGFDRYSADSVRETESAREVARQMIDGAKLGNEAMVEYVYGDLLLSRVGPQVSDEARIEALAAARRDIKATMSNMAESGFPAPSAAQRGEIAYLAMAPIIDSAQRGDYVASAAATEAAAAERDLRVRITEMMRPDDVVAADTEDVAASGTPTPTNTACPTCGGVEDPDEGRCLRCAPPTKGEVKQAEAHVRALGPRERPMYRGDWERRTGGRGPTVAEHRAQVQAQADINGPIRDAEARAERLRAAYEASDKSQDVHDEIVRCANCGYHYNSFEYSKCPECSYEN